MSLLRVRGLVKNYGRRRVVDGVDFEVDPGEIVGLLGPNGAGKTTSFYMIVGLVRPDAGEISIEGRAVEHMPIHRRSRLGLSYLPQEASIFRKLSVQDNVRAVLELQRGPQGKPLERPEIERRLEGLLQDLRVEHLRDSPALALSGGERRRVEIARALATQPRFILLDEPFAGIDPIAVIEIQRIIDFLKSRGIGVLITDHNVRETLGICDHAYIISERRVLAQGTPPAATLTAPANGATDLNIAPTLTWTAIPGATGYLVQVATDAAFTNIVATGNVSGTSYTVTPALNTSTPYFWRVRATNTCGDGAYSPVFNFTTGVQFCFTGSVAIPDNNTTGANADLAVANTVLDTHLSEEARTREVEQALGHTGAVEKTLTQSAETLDEVNTALDKAAAPPRG